VAGVVRRLPFLNKEWKADLPCCGVCTQLVDEGESLLFDVWWRGVVPGDVDRVLDLSVIVRITISDGVSG
jgi:hypothetical protein